MCIQCTENNWIWKDANCLCVSLLLNNMGWYLGIIVKLYDDACLIYIFTGKVQNGTPSIFNNSLYHFWYKNLGIKFHQ